MTAKIEVQGLNAWFRNTQALRDVSLTVPQNSVLAIIGPSGCGKSTLLNCMVGLRMPAKGDVLYDGQSFWKADHRTGAILASSTATKIRSETPGAMREPNLGPVDPSP